MSQILLVMAGGAIGAAMRFLAGAAALRALGPGYPWGTLLVNLAGGLLMGVLAGSLTRMNAPEGWRLFLGVGILGGFTTFSAFSLEAAMMIERGQLGVALGYALASVVGSVLALFAGLAIARSVAA
jgi:fluoride exporter